MTRFTPQNEKPPVLEARAAYWLHNRRQEVRAENGASGVPHFQHLLGRNARGVSIVSDVANLPLAHGVAALVDAADYPELSRLNWFLHRGGKHCYAASRLNGSRQLVFMHRFLLGATRIDRVIHLNADGLDNRRVNLELRPIKTTPEERERSRAYRINRPAVPRVPRDQIHRLSNLDRDSRVAICAVCGPVIASPTSRSRFRCPVQKANNAWRLRQKRSGRNIDWISGHYQKYKGRSCERCGFLAVHPIQLDVHHIDHNHSNNLPANLETICSNCHRLDHLVRWFPDGWERVSSKEEAA